MRIGIDARPLATQSGIGRYTRQILERWGNEKRHEFFLYGCADADAPWRDIHTRPLPRIPGVPGTALTQVCYPLWARLDGLEAFWSPRHHLPLLSGTPTVVTIHDLVWLKAPETMMRLNRILDALLMPRAVRQADLVIAVSNSTRRDLVEWRPSAEPKIRVIPCAPIFHPPELPSKPLIEPPYILFVGTFEPRKNLSRLLEAYAALRRTSPQTPNLVLAGGSGWRYDVTFVVTRLGLSNCVKVLDSPRDEDLVSLYEHCLFLAAPSLYEGFGLPIVEAMAFGKPVVVGNTSSMPEVTGKGGLLVNPRSSESIANAMRQLLENPAFRDSMGARARDQAASFSWQKAADDTLTLIEAAASRQIPG